MDSIVKYKDLKKIQKEVISTYVLKHIINNKDALSAGISFPMSIWTGRIRQIIDDKKDKFKINIDFDINGYSTFRSIFDLLYKDLRVITQTKTGKTFEYYLDLENPMVNGALPLSF
jgi:hypothetical protein